MAFARARRHYRAAQAQTEYERGLFIPDGVKPKVIAILAGISAILFITGVLLGLLAGRD